MFNCPQFKQYLYSKSVPHFLPQQTWLKVYVDHARCQLQNLKQENLNLEQKQFYETSQIVCTCTFL